VVVACSPGVVVGWSEGGRLFLPCILPGSLVPVVLVLLLGGHAFSLFPVSSVAVFLLPEVLVSVAFVLHPIALFQSIALGLDYELRLLTSESVAGGCWLVRSLGSLEHWRLGAFSRFSGALAVLRPLCVVPWVLLGLPRWPASLVGVPVRQLDCGGGY
jgi:hypothetical protein